MCKSIHFWICIRKMHMFFSTIGEVRSREVTSDAASFVRVFWKSVLFFVLKNNCNGKYNGLASWDAQKRFLAMFYKVFCTCVSENTVKHTQRATFGSENAIKLNTTGPQPAPPGDSQHHRATANTTGPDIHGRLDLFFSLHGGDIARSKYFF